MNPHNSAILSIMDKVETLQRIKEAEARIAEMVANAEREKDSILREAKREALLLQEELARRAEEGYQTVLADLEKQSREERERILLEGKARAEELRSRGMSNLGKAVDLLLRRFEEEVRAEA